MVGSVDSLSFSQVFLQRMPANRTPTTQNTHLRTVCGHLSQHYPQISRCRLVTSAHLRHHQGMDLAQALTEMGGAARYGDLRAAGIPAGTLRSLPSPVQKVGRGIFALPETPSDILAARALSGQIGCLSACLHWRLPLLDRLITPHIVVGRHRGGSLSTPDGVKAIVHRSDRHSLAGLRANPIDAIDQAARCTSPIGQVAMLDHAIRRGLVAPRDARALQVGPRRRREWVAGHVDPRAESILESVARCAMQIAGFAVEPQVWFGRNTRVDFVVEDKVVVETDGAQHNDPRAVAYDRTRDRSLLLRDLPAMHYGYAEVLPSPTLLVREVGTAVGKAPYRNWVERLEWALTVPRR